MASPSAHIMSVDVEEYFMVEAFAGSIPRASWHAWESRVGASTHRVLDLFDTHNVKATFFFVGWIAQQHPQLVRDVHARGHEIACHSFWHRPVYSLTPREFREDTRAAVRAIEDAAGVKVNGYRAPSWSITKNCVWALDILAEEGFTYDSSIYPIYHDLYGVPDAQRFPYTHICGNGKTLCEFPPATVRFFGQNLPGAGGGYLRIFPPAYTRWVFRKFEHVYRERVVVYFHPWELDPGQPPIREKLKSRIRHYTNLDRMEGRLGALLEKHSFQPFRDLLATELVRDSEPCSHRAQTRTRLSLLSRRKGSGSSLAPGDSAITFSSRSIPQRGADVLTYHALSAQRSSSAYTLSCQQFEEHLRVVSELTQIGNGTLRTLSVTFDDGHLSNFEYALPLLQRYSMRATFFVVASFVNSRPDFMTWAQLREIATLGHEIQSHSWSHPLLTHCSNQQLQDELIRSRQTIEQHLGRPVHALSVPGGRWNPRVLRAAATAGYRCVYVSDPWVASPRQDVNLLGRLTIKNSMGAGHLRGLLTGEGLYPAFFRAGYRAKEFFRQVVGDAMYRRVWSSISSSESQEPLISSRIPAGSFEKQAHEHSSVDQQ